jgi:formylglycine-generating enzyme required for sulfatase activity
MISTASRGRWRDASERCSLLFVRGKSAVIPLLLGAAVSLEAACSLAFPVDKYRADPLDGATSDGLVDDTGAAGDGSEVITDACGTYLGGKMVMISGYCIDVTEVTHGWYNQFLAAGVTPQSVTGAPTVCNWNADYGTAVSGRDDFPVVNVDWCDAYAFCAWAGKRLCGSTEGGSVDPSNAASSLSEWWVACTNGDAKTTWPYGSTFSNSICNGDPDHILTNGPSKVGSYTGCHGVAPPYDAVFDMSGNVEEWEDGCYQDHGPDDGCSLRGGDWGSNPDTDLACAHDQTEPRNTIHESVGFRCCSK